MVWILPLIIVAFLVLNYKIGKHDYMYPPFLYSFVFLVSSLVCALGAEFYSISLSGNTVLIIVFSLLLFTIIVPMFGRHYFAGFSRNLTYIEVKDSLYIIFVFLQIICICFFVKYLNSIMSAYMAAGYTHLAGPSLSEKIKLYDTLTKFWGPIYSELAVSPPLVYRILNPICETVEYMLLYIGVNNFIVNKRLNKYCIFISILMVVRILLNGSRSPLLRIMTFIIIIYYILKCRCGEMKKGDYKFLKKIIVVGLFFIVFMFLALWLTGRLTEDTSLFNELFVYMGAPIANLNIFIDRYNPNIFAGVSSDLFGAHTFTNLYNYIAKIFSLEINITSFSQFEFSGGYEIGNVYTMFAAPLFDFGYLGVMLIVSFIGIYYGRNYYKIMYSPRDSVFDYRLFIYAYLINDLIMSFFSNRFFETVCNAPFIKMIIISFIIYIYFFDRGLLFKNRFRIKKKV